MAKLSERAEEVLETLWMREIEKHQLSAKLGEAGLGEADAPLGELTGELTDEGLVSLAGSNVGLTTKGRIRGEAIVRRHRLAERLLADVLDVRREVIEDAACGFEHSLYEGIDENICTLLGHPRFCPHGRPIPQGDCCRRERVSPSRLVTSLSELRPGETGKIAYIHTEEARKLQKLMAMGVLPGMDIKLIQRLPSYVFQMGHSQFAVDEDIAESIRIRLQLR